MIIRIVRVWINRNYTFPTTLLQKMFRKRERDQMPKLGKCTQRVFRDRSIGASVLHCVVCDRVSHDLHLFLTGIFISFT